MEDEKYKNYLLDLGLLAKEYSREAIEDHRVAKGVEKTYAEGYKMAFHRIITLMQQQADAFEIPLNEIRLEDIDEKEFLK
ncbi:MAG: hypothetical protein K6L74_00370 [Neptuniibacter sp.]